jgi:type IV pilus assembly protein PilM
LPILANYASHLNYPMKFKFLSKNLPSFGLDVSAGSLKVMQLSRKKHNYTVKAFSQTAMPKGLIINDAISDAKTFNFLLKQTLDKPNFGKLDTNFVVASLPESKSFVRVIQIPRMSEAEAENAVPYEAESFIPMPIDQVYLDWQKIGDTGDKMNILIIASPKEFVDKYLEVLDKSGLKPVALEVESQSCRRAVVAADSKETFLIVELNALRSSLIMIEEGNLQFTSTIPIAGNSFTESIARALGVAGAKAEDIKKKVGLSNTAEYPNIKTALLPILNNLTAEIKNILKFHAEHSAKPVTRILLTGGSARLINLAEYLGDQLKDTGVVKTELANPWQNFNFGSNTSLSPSESLGYVSTIGLAIRGADFEVQ